MSFGGSLMRALGWPQRKLGLVPLASLSALALGAAIIAPVVWFYAHRETEPLHTDRLLTNYFAYYQDLVVAPLFLLVPLGLWFWRGRAVQTAGPDRSTKIVGLLALAVLLGCYAGARLLFRGYGLSIDEHMADFDAQILRSGRLFAPVAPEWRGLLDALEPNFIFKTSDGSLWSSSYLPGNAALRALVGLAVDADWTSPLLAAASLLLLFSIARQIHPGERSLAVPAVLLLASSSQFLITAMTPYAMTAHLALNLAWLWCVLHNRCWSRVTAVAISFLACGLHQMIFHPLFVAPFLPWLWFGGRRWQAVLYAVSVAAFALFWINYWSIALALVAPDQTIAGLLHVPLADRVEALVTAAGKPIAAIMTADNLLRLLTWQNPLLWPLIAAAAFSVRRQPSIAWPLFGGIVATFGAMLLLMPQQGHGWGYRYLHGLLGNLALLGAMGWEVVRQEQRDRLQPWLVASLALSLLLLLPVRIMQADAFTRPYILADARISALDADVVILEHRGRWFGNDLVRNAPFLRSGPIRLLSGKLPADKAAQLCSRYRVAVLRPSSPALTSLRQMPPDRSVLAGEARLKLFEGLGCR